MLTAGTDGHDGEIRIDLSDADFPIEYTLSTEGEDVRVFAGDGITTLPYAVTAWSAADRTATIYIRPPPLSANTSHLIYLYFGDPDLTDASDTSAVFPDIGLRLRSRYSTVDPETPEEALTAFAASTIDIYDAVRSSMNGANNQSLGGTNGDFAWCVSAMLEVTSAMEGVWEFRYGADFGLGGHLYVDGIQLEEQWTDDLWWNMDWLNTAETLEGAINLGAGFHRYEALGFEGCCDGAVGWQARAPGGVWQDFNSTNFPIRAAQCVNTTVTVSPSVAESCSTILDAHKSVELISDPTGSATPYALPGALMAYQITVANPGQPVDSASLVLTDIVPEGTELVVEGPLAFEMNEFGMPTGLNFSWGGPSSDSDSVEFSTDGIDFAYIPTPSGPHQTDPNVTFVRFRPSGSLAPHQAGQAPSFSVRFMAQLN